MKLMVAAVGSRMPTWVQTAWEEYTRRLPAHYALELRPIKPEPRTQGKTCQQIKAAEAQRIIAALPTQALRVALDEQGSDITTVALAQALQQWRDNDHDVAFIVGGADGLDAALKSSCQRQIRLSSMTLPHALVRVLLAEQLYRAWTLLTNHPYHRI